MRGFSLVELSIVLVILGLLTGGILAGQSLIRAAELRSVSSEYSRYTAAVHSFRDRYFQFPGDMNNATRFWGTLGGDGSNFACQNIASADAKTCNGNGDGIIGWPSSPIPGGTVVNDVILTATEGTRFWQHMANAGLIEGSYSGKSNADSAGVPVADGTNAPLSRAGGGAYWLPSGSTATASAGNAVFFPKAAGSDKRLTLVPINVSPMYVLSLPIALIFTPEEAWNLDTKMDDGLPNKGRVTTYKANNCTNVSGVAPPGDANAQYMLTNSTKVCGLLFDF